MISSSSVDALSRIASSRPPFPPLRAKEGDRRHEEEEAPSFPNFTPLLRVLFIFRAADNVGIIGTEEEDCAAPTTALMSRLLSSYCYSAAVYLSLSLFLQEW